MTDLELSYLFVWWCLLFGIGVASLPLVWKLFSKFSDGGYGFSKIFGTLIISYTVFVLSIGKIAPFSFTTCLLAIGGLGLSSLLILRKNKDEFREFIKKSKYLIVLQEVLFTSGYVFWSWVKGFQPDIAGLEKFMDLGFVNAALRSEYLPPTDIWFAGKSINYYWFGHFMTAVLTKIANIPTGISYNLMLATLLGLTLTGAFSLSSSLVGFLKNHTKRMVVTAGLLSAFLLAFGGNFHTPYFIIKNGYEKLDKTQQNLSLLQELNSAVSLGYESYWYPDATRFIGYNPDVPDKTIHEFPMYSFVVSDLHAHLLNLPLVLTFIGLLISFIVTRKKHEKTSRLIVLGFLIGVFFMTNTWDVGNYLLLTGIVLGLFSLFENRLHIKTITEPAFLIGTILLTALATALPFIFNFESIAQGVDRVNAQSALWQLALLWGFPLVLFVTFMTTLIFRRKNLQEVELFAVGVFVTAFILIIIPELVYVKDIYIASHHRANTMFKLTYQSFVMSYALSGFVAVYVVTSISKRLKRGLVSLFFAFVFALIFIYPTKAIDTYYGSFTLRKSMDGEKWLLQRYPSEYQALAWIRENVPNDSVLLEAPGDSYTDYNVLSAYSGLPTVSGWFVHEWLWRGDASFPQNRVTDIVTIYTSTDKTLTKTLLKKYSVDYVIVGTFEREKYTSTLNEAKFTEIGERVFSAGKTSIYKIN